MLSWEQVSGEFYWDGSWRDIYVLGTSLEDWQRALDALRLSSFSMRYFRDGVESPVPRAASEAFPEPGRADRLLSVDLHGPIANTHFFTESEIEFDLDPREVQGQRELEGVVQFMRILTEATGRETLLTPENQKHIRILRVSPSTPHVEHNLFGGYR